mgnify:CR=1 FL=1
MCRALFIYVPESKSFFKGYDDIKFEIDLRAQQVIEQLDYDHLDGVVITSLSDWVKLKKAVQGKHHSLTIICAEFEGCNFKIASEEKFSLIKFLKMCWCCDQGMFKSQVLVFSSTSANRLLKSIFKFRKTFCRYAIAPQRRACGSEEYLYKAINSYNLEQTKNQRFIHPNSYVRCIDRHGEVS